jgi:hypothetical protein
MQIKLIDNPVKLAEFLNNPANTGNIVDSGDKYLIKPDAVYLGIYEGLMLAGVFEVRKFWHMILECHSIMEPGFRGRYALDAHRLFCRFALDNFSFNGCVTFVPEKTKYGRTIITILGAKRVGMLRSAYNSIGVPIDAAMYEITRDEMERCAANRYDASLWGKNSP